MQKFKTKTDQAPVSCNLNSDTNFIFSPTEEIPYIKIITFKMFPTTQVLINLNFAFSLKTVVNLS